MQHQERHRSRAEHPKIYDEQDRVMRSPLKLKHAHLRQAATAAYDKYRIITMIPQE